MAERICNPRLLGGRKRRRPLNGRDDLGQHFFVQPALDPAQVGRQFGDNFPGWQAQNLVTRDVRVVSGVGIPRRIDAVLGGRWLVR